MSSPVSSSPPSYNFRKYKRKRPKNAKTKLAVPLDHKLLPPDGERMYKRVKTTKKTPFSNPEKLNATTNRLPNELLMKILRHVGHNFCFPASFVCRRWRFCVQVLVPKKSDMIQHACQWAAGSGQLDLLKWLHESGCPLDEWAYAYAAEAGHFAVLEWLYRKECPLTVQAYMFAIRAGHLDVLKWLHKKGFPWGYGACYQAAKSDRSDILKWLHKKGFFSNSRWRGEPSCTKTPLLNGYTTPSPEN